MKNMYTIKLDGMVLQAEMELHNAQATVSQKIINIQTELDRAQEYIHQDEWRGVNSCGVIQGEGASLDASIAEVHALKRRLADLKTMREVALAAVKAATEQTAS